MISRLACFLPFTSILFAQNPEVGVTILRGSERVLKVDANRPMDVAANLLANNYQVHVNVEDPPYECSDDLIDTKPGRKSPFAPDHEYIPKGGAFEVRFSVDQDRRPVSLADLLQRTVAAYNQANSFRYRLQQQSSDIYSFIAVAGRNKNCRMIPLLSLLDRKISLSAHNKGIGEVVHSFETALSQKSGESVSLIRADAGMEPIPDLRVSIEAKDESARDVLLQMIKATHYRTRWITQEASSDKSETIILYRMTGSTVQQPGGGFLEPWLLWPGAKPAVIPAPPIAPYATGILDDPAPAPGPAKWRQKPAPESPAESGPLPR